MSRNSFVLLSFGMGNTLRNVYVTIFSCPHKEASNCIVLSFDIDIKSGALWNSDPLLKHQKTITSGLS